MRTREEYLDFMTNVRVSMSMIHRVVQEVGILHVSSKQAAKVTTSMDEVAIFLKLKKPELSLKQEEEKVEGGQEGSQQQSAVEGRSGLDGSGDFVQCLGGNWTRISLEKLQNIQY